jgi:hypothetical protein
MKIRTEYQIFKSAAMKDDSRPVLQNIYVERLDGNKGVAVATDGCMMAVVPVELSDEDVPGLVPGTCVQDAIKTWKKFGKVDIILKEGEVSYLGKSGIVTAKRLDAKFPDWQKLVPTKPEDQPVGMFSIDPSRLAALCDAIGANCSNVVPKLTRTGRNSPIIVETWINGNTPCAPFGILMPMEGKG